MAKPKSRSKPKAPVSAAPVEDEMDEADFASFATALGEELGEAVASVSARPVIPQDGYEVYSSALRRKPSPRQLAALTDRELEQLRDACRRCIDVPKVTIAHMRAWIAGTLRRWPA